MISCRFSFTPFTPEQGIADGSCRRCAIAVFFPSLADDDQLAVERFDDDGNTTGPGLAPVGYSLHTLHFLTLFRNRNGISPQSGFHSNGTTIVMAS